MSRNFLQVFEARSYENEGTQRPAFKRKRGWRKGMLYVIVFLLVVVAIGAASWLIFSKTWRLTEVEITGVQTLSQDDLRLVAVDELSKHVFGLPKNHRWLAPTDKIKERLLSAFPLQSVEMQKDQNVLRISVVEDVTVIALRSGDAVGFLDRTGRVLRLADPLEVVAIKTRLNEITPNPEEQAGLPLLPAQLPIIQTAHPVSIDVGLQIYTSTVMDNLVAMDSGLQRRDIQVRQYVSEAIREPWFRVMSNLPYEIYFDAEHDIEQQLKLLQTVMKEYEADPPLHYLDVRFGDRVFIR